MTQILDSLPIDCPEPLLCSYVNSSTRMQIVRISNIPGWYFERVVFPGQRLLFRAPAMGLLEINSTAIASAILADHIPCRYLRVEEDEPEEKGGGPFGISGLMSFSSLGMSV